MPLYGFLVKRRIHLFLLFHLLVHTFFQFHHFIWHSTFSWRHPKYYCHTCPSWVMCPLLIITMRMWCVSGPSLRCPCPPVQWDSFILLDYMDWARRRTDSYWVMRVLFPLKSEIDTVKQQCLVPSTSSNLSVPSVTQWPQTVTIVSWECVISCLVW